MEGVRLAISTSRSPSKRTAELVNDLVNSLPGTARVVRGHRSLLGLLEEARSLGASRVAVIWERDGAPSLIRFADVERRMWMHYALKLVGVKSRADYGVYVARRPRARSAVIVDAAGGELAEVIMDVLGYPVVHGELERYRQYDTILFVRQGTRAYIIDILGRDLGPRAASLRVERVLYMEPRCIA